MDELNSKFDKAKVRISELKQRTGENNENTVQRDEQQTIRKSITDQEERRKRPILLLIGIPKVKNRDNEGDGIHGITAKMIFRMMKDVNPQVQEE